MTLFNKTIMIGSQEWSINNLDVETFRNGEMIPEAKSDEEWQKMAEEKKPAWCYHPRKYQFDQRHGRLYNWYAINDIRGLAPSGWRIPDIYDWELLQNFLGERIDEMLKSTSWKGTNKSGFDALPSGVRCGPDTIPEWEFQGDKEEEYACFWTCTENEEEYAYSIIFGDLVNLL